ncbi:alpha/beta hydrolase [Amycolatopsis cihanbeyliensis]|nr:alpha/beta hydrolase [Amycolatopsis cihanbeyliensis]
MIPVLAGCTAGPSTRPAIVQNDGPAPQAPQDEPAQVPLPPLAEPRASGMSWSECRTETSARLGDSLPAGLSFSCGRVITTLDTPDLPGRGVIRLSLLKVGDGPIPLAVLNDVDGEPGSLHAARIAKRLPPEVLERFSLIGVDRRGTGQSDPIGCVPTHIREQLLGYDPAATEVAPLLDAARKAGQQCTIGLENRQTAYDGWRTAGDLDEIRAQLGLDHLHAIGHGEGSSVLTAYATRYPDRVGRMVLDGIPDPSPNTVSVLADIAAGTLSTLDRFGEDCADRDCALGDARKAVTALAEQLRTAPLYTPNGTRMGPALALHAVRIGLGQRERWPDLAAAIAAARGGDAAGLAAFVAPLLRDTSLHAPRLDAALATMCNDMATRLPEDRINEVLRDAAGKQPLFGTLLAQRLAWCGPWPVRTDPLPEAGARGAPPIMVISTATDPVTPEKGTIRAAEQLPSAVRIAWQGAGHGALASSCVTDATRDFLVEGTVPKEGTLCPA